MKRFYAHYNVDEQKAIAFGAIQTNKGLQYTHSLSEYSVNIVLTLNHEHITIDVYDQDTHEYYQPFYIQGMQLSIHQEVEQIIQIILTQCYIKQSLFHQILDNMLDLDENIAVKSPFKKYPEHLALCRGEKWFALYMKIDYQKLDNTKSGIIEVVNVKIQPEDIAYIDHKTFFPAYHMNKKHWMSIRLHNKMPIETVYTLIERSYYLIK